MVVGEKTRVKRCLVFQENKVTEHGSQTPPMNSSLLIKVLLATALCVHNIDKYIHVAV